MTHSMQLSEPSRGVDVVKEVSFDLMCVFSGFPEQNSVHTSRAFAVAAGLPNAVAQGLQTYAYMCEWLVGFFGANWFVGGNLGVSFVAIVLPGDLVTVKGEVTDSETSDRGNLVTVRIWCENHRGEVVAAGTATSVIT